jgi:hypothetical protein
LIVAIGEELSYVTVTVSEPTFPAASRARTVMTLSPATSATLAMLQLVVPDAVPDPPVAALVHVTVVTPTLSEAVPPIPSGEDEVVYAGDDVGEVIAQTGAVTSGGV